MAQSYSSSDIKNILEEKYRLFNQKTFIENDPICIPHSFSRKEDIEISAFLTSTIAWGNRKSIINNAKKMMLLLENSPYDFIINHTTEDLKKIKHFSHRTFNIEDFLNFIHCLKSLYLNHGGLEQVFSLKQNHEQNLAAFPSYFFEGFDHLRTFKHVAKIDSGSAAKRLNMFLRWMVRKDDFGVDFGIWHNINMANLFIPLDVHSGRSARSLGLLHRKQNDWKAVLELTVALRSFDSKDPVKYDFSLFGMGVMENII